MAQAQSIGGTFTLIKNATPKRRLIVAVDGREKEGKTNFALTSPGPIAFQNFDIGLEGVIEKFQSEKQIYVPESYGFTVNKEDDEKTIMAKTKPVWERFVTEYRVMLESARKGGVRTGVIDTGSEAWEVLRLARFGKLTQIMPHHYTTLNTEYRNLIREAYDTSINLVILHRLKAEWQDNPLTGKGGKTGRWERAGYADTGFLVQVNVRMFKRVVNGQTEFVLQVVNCRQNPKIDGLELINEMASFPWLAVNVYPDSSLEDWM